MPLLIGDTQRGRRESDTVVMHNKFTEPLMAGEHLFRLSFPVLSHLPACHKGLYAGRVEERPYTRQADRASAYNTTWPRLG